MNCFSHSHSAAVGVCRHCGRGVCRDCARTDGAGLACSDACVTQLAELHEINERAKRIYGVGASARRQLPLAPMMWGAFALLFLGFGVGEFYRHGRIEWFLVLFGLVCGVMCVMTWQRLKDLKLNC